MRKRFPALLVAILLCNGCVTFGPNKQTVGGHKLSAPIPAEMVPKNYLKCDKEGLPKLRVGTVIGGRETVLIRGTTLISNEAFAQALKSTLDTLDFLDDGGVSGDGGLEIRAYIADVSNSETAYGFFQLESVTTKLSVSYKIIDISTDNILWQEDFYSTSMAHYLDSVSNWKVLAQKAYEGAVRENLKQLSVSLCNNLIAISQPPSNWYDMESPAYGAGDRDRPTLWPDNVNDAALHLRIGFGSFTPNNNPGELSKGKSRFGLGFGITQHLDFSKYIDIDVDALGISTYYDGTIPPYLNMFTQVDDNMSLVTQAIMTGVRIRYPSSRKFYVYANGGGGLFINKLTVGVSTLGFPGTIEEKDISAGWYVGAGMLLSLSDSNKVLSVEYRQFSVEGSFRDFGLSNVDIGGEYIGLSFGKYF